MLHPWSWISMGGSFMDARSFDALTQHLTEGMPRRNSLAVLIGGISSLLLGGTSRVEAGCKKVGKKCDKNKDCCNKARCRGKKCKCKSGFTECGGKCFDLDKDDKHCGSCNTACATGESCVAGVCAEGGCTADRDSCAPDALCITCPDRPDSVCYVDNDGVVRCSLVILCFNCEDDLDCEGFGPGARCVQCAGQCGGGGACAAD
jgi:hypothetical protein